MIFLKLKTFKNCLGNTWGATAIEFAVILPVYLLLIFGIIELGYFFWGYSALEYGGSYAARYAFANPTLAASQIQSYALSYVDLPGNVISYNVTTVPYVSFTIEGTFTYSPLYIPFGPVTVDKKFFQYYPLP